MMYYTTCNCCFVQQIVHSMFIIYLKLIASTQTDTKTVLEKRYTMVT